MLSTIQDSAGHPVGDLSKIDDPSKYTVEVDGTRTSLEVAIRLGYVNKDASGYFDGEPGQTFIPEDIQPENHLSAPVSGAVNELKARFGENGANALLSSAVGAVVEGESDGAFSRFGNEVGLVSAEEGKAVAEKIASELESSLVERTAIHYDLDPGELSTFLNSCDSGVKVQLLLRTLHGDPSVKYEFASRWKYKNIR